MAKYIDLTGLKFNDLTVVKMLPQRMCLCKCVCGNEKITLRQSVKLGKITSCGCKLGEKRRDKLEGTTIKGVTFIRYLSNRRWLCKCHCGNEWETTAGSIKDKRKPKVSCGCSKTNGKPDGHRATTATYNKYKGWAKRFGREFTLTREEFVSIIFSDCHYCGCPPAQVRNVKADHIKHKNKVSVITMNGVDRKNNDVGYTSENCVAACKMCNFMKRAYSYDGFINHIKKIAQHIQSA